jgi:hypothetical protein
MYSVDSVSRLLDAFNQTWCTMTSHQKLNLPLRQPTLPKPAPNASRIHSQSIPAIHAYHPASSQSFPRFSAQSFSKTCFLSQKVTNCTIPSHFSGFPSDPPKVPKVTYSKSHSDLIFIRIPCLRNTNPVSDPVPAICIDLKSEKVRKMGFERGVHTL